MISMNLSSVLNIDTFDNGLDDRSVLSNAVNQPSSVCQVYSGLELINKYSRTDLCGMYQGQAPCFCAGEVLPQ